MQALLTSIRLTVATMAICVAGYATVIWGVAQALTPATAAGSLIRSADGTVVGSRLIAQSFTRPGYFWPRPSAAGKTGYDATAAAGSNKSPTSSDVADRGREIASRYGATPDNPLPPDLAAASGGGLDPHISERGAIYQARRVADARGIEVARVEALIRQHAEAPGGPFTPDRIVNVLELNIALDGIAPLAR